MTATTAITWDQPARIARAYGGAFVAFLAIDYVWLTQIGPNIYRTYIPHLMADTVNYPAAVIFYLLYIAGIAALAVAPSRTAKGALIRGAFLGLFAYGTFDLTSNAAFKDWPAIVTVVDMAWGTFLTGLVSVASFKMSR